MRVPAAREFHRFLAYAVLLPCGVTFVTGVVLLLRQDFEWIQPKARVASVMALPTVPLAEAVAIAQKAYAAGTGPSGGALTRAAVAPSSVEARPAKGTWNVRFSDGFEVQLDGRSGAVLAAERRRTGWLIELHQGSWFHPSAMKAVFLPSGLILVILWLTGAWMLVPMGWRRRFNLREERCDKRRSLVLVLRRSFSWSIGRRASRKPGKTSASPV